MKQPTKEVYLQTSQQGEAVVLCPHCQGCNLHHVGMIYNYRNSEDSKNGMEIKVGVDGCEWGWGKYHEGIELNHVPIQINNSPKHIGRRGSILIEFICENGCEPFHMQILQHKGSTYLSAVCVGGAS